MVSGDRKAIDGYRERLFPTGAPTPRTVASMSGRYWTSRSNRVRDRLGVERGMGRPQPRRREAGVSANRPRSEFSAAMYVPGIDRVLLPIRAESITTSRRIVADETDRTYAGRVASSVRHGRPESESRGRVRSSPLQGDR
jgi:hypothetical protein